MKLTSEAGMNDRAMDSINVAITLFVEDVILSIFLVYLIG